MAFCWDHSRAPGVFVYVCTTTISAQRLSSFAVDVTRGNGGFERSRYEPVPQMPTNAGRMRTCPGPGSGVAISLQRMSSFPWNWIAFIAAVARIFVVSVVIVVIVVMVVNRLVDRRLVGRLTE